MDAEKIADSLVEFLRKIDGVKEVIVAGSFRRRKETVGDLDILVTTSKNSHAMQRLLKYDGIKNVVSQKNGKKFSVSATSRGSAALRLCRRMDVELNCRFRRERSSARPYRMKIKITCYSLHAKPSF